MEKKKSKIFSKIEKLMHKNGIEEFVNPYKNSDLPPPKEPLVRSPEAHLPEPKKVPELT